MAGDRRSAPIATSARTGAIKLDQGQTTYRAARLLLKGENPYGFGALVDFQAVKDRWPEREAAGIAPRVARANLETALADYDRGLGAEARAAILPPAPRSGPAALEAHLLGYKYGALFPLLALPLAAAGLPAGIMALNALVAALTIATLYALMRERVGDPRLARLGLAALVCDNAILVNYVEKSATDVYALHVHGAGGARRRGAGASTGPQWLWRSASASRFSRRRWRFRCCSRAAAGARR